MGRKSGVSDEVRWKISNIKAAAAALEQVWKERRRPQVLTWDGLFRNEGGIITTYPVISLCTTSMNRLHNVRKTLRKNIEDNADYKGRCEFVLLDYNSTDGLGEWVQNEMSEYVETGVLNYYRTEEPRYYNMSHSRNIAFKVATGQVVNNVDADAYTNAGFVSYIARLAGEQPTKATFAKSRQLLRGRLGFYRQEFIDLLGGYDEDLKGYGHDDQDLMIRAWELGFTLMPFRGPFSGCVDDHIKHEAGNYEEEYWWTEGCNRLKSFTNIFLGRYKANEGRHWGKAHLVKNFTEELDV